MKKQINTWINVINTLLVLITFSIPKMELKYRLIILAVIAISFILNFTKKYIKKNSKIISIILLLLISFLLIFFIDNSLLLPSLVIVLTCLGTTLILVSNIDKSEDIIIFSDSSFRDWKINHWGTNYCSVKGDGMHFFGKDTKDEDGAHIDLIGELKIGEKYIVECYTKSLPNTNGQVKL